MSAPLDQLPRQVAGAFRNAKLRPYRVNTITGIKVSFNRSHPDMPVELLPAIHNKNESR